MYRVNLESLGERILSCPKVRLFKRSSFMAAKLFLLIKIWLGCYNII